MLLVCGFTVCHDKNLQPAHSFCTNVSQILGLTEHAHHTVELTQKDHGTTVKTKLIPGFKSA